MRDKLALSKAAREGIALTFDDVRLMTNHSNVVVLLWQLDSSSYSLYCCTNTFYMRLELSAFFFLLQYNFLYGDWTNGVIICSGA